LNPRREKAAAGVSSSSNAAPNEKSVAVLAFANLSDDKGSEYFSDGISEELLTVLQKIPGLHVAARTSAFSFKGKNATAQEIGQKLGVAHLVEGSVRKAGDVVRIAARLTQANTGEEQWSENYTRNLKDVFAVQTEIAQTIVEQLRGQLTSGGANPTTKAEIQAEVRAAVKGGTRNVDAHQHYLQGRFYTHRHSEKSTGETLRGALALAPADPALLIDAGTLAVAKGDMTRGIALYRQAVTVDPVNPRALAFLAGTLVSAGQLADAQVEYARLLELSPASPNAHAGLGGALLLQGKFEEAGTAANEHAAEAAGLTVVAMARWSQKRIPESDAALARLIESSADTAAYQIADVYAYRGEKDRAFEWLERARRQRDSGLTGVRNDPLFAHLHEDPRWNAFVYAMGLADDQLK